MTLDQLKSALTRNMSGAPGVLVEQRPGDERLAALRADVWLDVVVNENVSLQPDPLGEDLLAVRADVAGLLPSSDALLAVVLEVRLVRGLGDLPLALGAS